MLSNEILSSSEVDNTIEQLNAKLAKEGEHSAPESGAKFSDPTKDTVLPSHIWPVVKWTYRDSSTFVMKLLSTARCDEGTRSVTDIADIVKETSCRKLLWRMSG